MDKKISVFCASSTKVAQKYFDQSKALGLQLVQNNYTLVYGGGSVGLMGSIADAVMQAGGKVIGYMPKFMMEVEWGKKDITELILVEDMHERKKRLIENIDAVVALPGGGGTLEELAEVMTLKRLGKFPKPIIILNQDGFYDDLIAFMKRMIAENFMKAEHIDIFTVVTSADEVIPAIHSAVSWNGKTISDAPA